MASALDHRGSDPSPSTTGASLAEERTRIRESLDSASSKSLQSVVASNALSDMVQHKQEIIQRLELLRKLDWLETVGSLTGSFGAGQGAPEDPAALQLFHIVAAHSPLDLAEACVACTGTNSSFNLDVLTVLIRYACPARVRAFPGRGLDFESKER